MPFYWTEYTIPPGRANILSIIQKGLAIYLYLCYTIGVPRREATEQVKPLPKELKKIYYSESKKVLDKLLPMWYNKYINKGRKTD